MEVIASKTELAQELYFLQGIVERKTAIPILANVLIEASDGRLVFGATDLDLALRTECAAQVSKPGSVTVSARKLYDIVRSLPEADVRMSLADDAWVVIECGQASFRVAGLPTQDFPTLPSPEGDLDVSLEATILADLISRTSFAITGEDARYFLAGALLNIEADGVAMVATDGHRLAYARRKADEGSLSPQRLLVPRKAVQGLARLLDAGGDLRFAQQGNHLLFQVGSRTLSSKLVEGQFPAYENVIEAKGDKIVELSREDLLTAIRRVSLVASERTRSVKVTLSPGWLTVAAVSPELGEASDRLPVEYEGQETSVGFNAQYFQDFLQAVSCQSVSLEIKNAESQGILRPVGDEATDHRYVVMPMRL
jgi:DNA polymerase-3 subunit beta